MVHNHRKKYWYGGVAALIFFVIFGFVIFKYIRQARRANDEMIAQHIEQLKGIFKNINETAKINGFRHQKAFIDFLNVAKFEGSVVGPMSLLEPEKWKGPYLRESLNVGGREYQIVATKKGYFIVPGDDVRLANGKVIGKTLIIDSNSDIDAMTRDPEALFSGDKPLAAHIETFETPGLLLEKAPAISDLAVQIANNPSN